MIRGQVQYVREQIEKKKVFITVFHSRSQLVTLPYLRSDHSFQKFINFFEEEKNQLAV